MSITIFRQAWTRWSARPANYRQTSGICHSHESEDAEDEVGNLTDSTFCHALVV